MGKGLQLRALTIDLLPAALELDRRCLGGLWSAEGYQREIESPNSELLILLSSSPSPSPCPLALLGLGCYWAILEEAHITLLAIDPACQRQGLGQTLLYALLTSARQRGLERATLEVKASNQAALSLYQRFGFEEAGRRKRYYPDTGEDAIVLWRGGLQYPQFNPTLQAWQQESCDRLNRAGWQVCSDFWVLNPRPAT